jgi:hypothetical protein
MFALFWLFRKGGARCRLPAPFQAPGRPQRGDDGVPQGSRRRHAVAAHPGTPARLEPRGPHGPPSPALPSGRGGPSRPLHPCVADLDVALLDGGPGDAVGGLLLARAGGVLAPGGVERLAIDVLGVLGQAAARRRPPRPSPAMPAPAARSSARSSATCSFEKCLKRYRSEHSPVRGRGKSSRAPSGSRSGRWVPAFAETTFAQATWPRPYDRGHLWLSKRCRFGHDRGEGSIQVSRPPPISGPTNFGPRRTFWGFEATPSVGGESQSNGPRLELLGYPMTSTCRDLSWR